MSDFLVCTRPYRGVPCVRPWVKYNWGAVRGSTFGPPAGYDAPFVVVPTGVEVSHPGLDTGGYALDLHFQDYATGANDHVDSYFLSSHVLYPEQEGLGWPNALTGVMACSNNAHIIFAKRANQGALSPAEPDSSGLWINATCMVHPLLSAFPTGVGSGNDADTYYAINTQFFQMPGTQHIYAIGGSRFLGTAPTFADTHDHAWVCRYPWTGATWSGTPDRAYKLSDSAQGTAFGMNLDYDGGGVLIASSVDGSLTLFDGDLNVLHTWSSPPWNSVYPPLIKDGFLFGSQNSNTTPWIPYSGCGLWRLHADYTYDFIGYLGDSANGGFIPTEPNEFSTQAGFILSITCEP